MKNKQIVLDKLWADILCFNFIHSKLKENIRIARKQNMRVRYCISCSSIFPFIKIDIVDIVDSELLGGSGTWYCVKTGEKLADWMA